MSRNLSDQRKFMAVGEALSETGTLTSIARKYGLSTGYLSMLASRARMEIESGQKAKIRKRRRASPEHTEIADLTMRLSSLEEKFNKIFK
ncbi:MAG: hypothetical protein EOM12_10065 [Verrucomicrobiae bacterium]|nr:hypothetical protein [Verrucomicrobiae bacterium]